MKETLKKSVEKPSFALKAKEAYEQILEKPKSIPEKVGVFISNAGKQLFKEFEQGNALKKIAILGGVAAAGYLTYKALKALGSAIVGGFKSLFGLGEKLKESLEGTHTDTIKGILKLALGGTLATGAIATLYEAINGKIPFSEILTAWNNDGIKGLGKLLLQKQKEGVIAIGKDIWGMMAPALGLPTLDKIKEQLAGVKENIDQAYAWLDEKCEFKGVKARMEMYFKDHDITMPEWLKNLSLTQMAKDLGIDKNDPKTWAEFAVAGGAGFMIYKWIGRKPGNLFAANAAIYLLIVKEGKNSFAGQILKSLGKEFDDAKKKILTKWAGSDIGNMMECIIPSDFKLENHIEDGLEWMSEHPAETMIGMNGMWMMRSVMIKGIKSIGRGTFDVAKFVLTNPKATLLIGAGATALYAGRRGFIEDFINITYDDAKSTEAVAMRKNLDDFFGVDRNKPETLGEKQTHQIVRELVEDPLRALNLASTAKAFQEGAIAFGTDILGKVFLVIRGFNVPIQLGNLTFENFKNFAHIYSDEHEGNVALSTAILGTECVVFGSAAYLTAKEQWKVIKVIHDAKEHGKKVSGVLKSFIPGTQEWRFALRSFASIPFIPMMRNLEGSQVGRANAALKTIEEEIIKASPDINKIKELARKTADDFREFEKVKTELSGTRFGYEFNKHFEITRRQLREIENLAINANTDPTQLKLIQSKIDEARSKILDYRSTVSRLAERWEFIKQGKIAEAFKLQTAEELAEGAEKAAAKPLDQASTFKRSHDTYKTNVELEDEARKLRTEIAALDPNDAARGVKQKNLTAIETYLSPTLATNPLDPKKVMETASTLEAREKGIKALFEKSIDDIVRDAKVRGVPLSDPSVRAKLVEMDEKFLQPFAKHKKTVMKGLFEEFKKMPAHLQTKAIRQQLNNALQGADGTLVTRVVKAAKGRAKFMAVMASMMFATDALIHRNDPERELINILESLGPDAGQLVLDCLPVAGTFSNFYSAIAGKEAVSGRNVSGGWDRASNVAWGIVGLAGDALAVLAAPVSAGTSVGANALLRLTKAAKGGSVVAKRLITMWPRIEVLVEKLGGWKKFSDKVTTYLRKNKGKVAGTLRTVEKAGMVTGGVLLAGGTAYHVFYNEVDSEEIEVPEL